MVKIVHDPLLAFARFLLMFFIVVLGIACAAAIVAVPAVPLVPQHVLVEFADKHVELGGNVIAAVMALLAGVAALLGLCVYFLLLLRRIVNSVGEGDPFVPDNADRLTRMGWIALAVQLGALALEALGSWIESLQPQAADDVTINVGIDISAVVLIVVLFILARVFRKGTEMREELEGTV